MSEWDPPDVAWELLEEFEAEPTDCEWLDMDLLLRRWGITESLPGQESHGYRALVHPGARHFPFRFPMKRRLAPATVLSICRAIRTLDKEMRR